MKKIIAILLILFTSISIGQTNLDSLWGIWSNTNESDTNRLRSIRIYAQRGYVFSDPDSAIYFTDLQFDFAEKINYVHFMADARNTQGVAYAVQSKFNFAIQKYIEALEYYEKDGDKPGQASTLNNIGILYSDLNELDKSLDYYQQSLDLKEELNDTIGMASTLNNMGVIYKGKEDYQKALELYLRCLDIESRAGEIQENIATLNNIAVVYKLMDSLEIAEQYALKSIEISKQFENKREMSLSYNILAIVQYEQDRFGLSFKNAKKAKQLALDVDAKNELREASLSIYLSSKSLGKYKLALENYEYYTEAKQAMLSDENQKEVIKQEYKYVYEKQAAADSIKNVEEKKIQLEKLKTEKAENKRQKHQSYFLYSGLGITLLFGIFIYNRFKITQKQKIVIEDQKQLVDKSFEELAEKNTEILDSINYAKRIQSAILPSNSQLKELMPNSFVLYKPKDIVAGDFYWLEPLNKSKEADQQVLFAAADCTGHGVPGAMVSVICNNALNRSVREYGLKIPGEILDKTREIVIEEFEKSDEEVKDGMDIALCCIRGDKLTYAGANNPLWIIRDNEIIEIKADKQPIGKFINPHPFTTHEILLKKNDSVYIFSDGLVDQFGGEKGKKYKPKALRELLLNVHNESLETQKTRIDEAFENWKGTFEQIDDVCLIGVKY